MKSDTFFVHRYEVFRSKFRVSGETMKDAIAKVEIHEEACPLTKLVPGEVVYLGREFADEVVHYVVDVEGDSEFALSQDFDPYGEPISHPPDGLSNVAFLEPTVLQSVMDIIEQTYAHDEITGERLDEPGSASGADVIEMLCNLESKISAALAARTVGKSVVAGGVS